VNNMIVCPEPPAAKAGQDIFAMGGNAMDAAIAAAFAQGVTNPLLCGLGGTGHAYFYHSKTRQRVVLDFEATVGSVPVPKGWANDFVGRSETVGRYILRSEANQIGYQSVMVPSFVRGCWVAFQRYGSSRILWSDLLKPALRLARDGFEVYHYIAAFWRHFESSPGYPGLLTKLQVTPDAGRSFLKPDGSVFDEGDRFVQPELAQTIERLADAGGEDFYTGKIGRAIAEDFARHDGLITGEDLRDYRVLEKQPLIGKYRGAEITSGAEFIEMFQILDSFDLRGLGHNTPEYIDIFARAMRATFADYARLKGMDMNEKRQLEQRMISPEHADHWAQRIVGGERLVVRGGAPDPGTTHVTCVDAERNVTGINHSIGSLAGSGVISPGLGFFYNNFLGHFNPLSGHPDSIEAGKRLGDLLATVVFKNGEPFVAVGAPGGSRIITSIVQSIVNVIDHNMDMRTAVSVPRFHSEEEQLLFLEPQFPESTVHRLRTMGNEVQRSTYMARVQAILIRSDTGDLEAGADPRGGGVGCYP
jgi:gamma-glutamyltranspeptidase/glutathione hydrolase